MSNLSIKDVPEQWAETLRQRAARNHRSLQGELMAIIEAAVKGSAAGEHTTFPTTASSGRDAAVGFDNYGKPIIRMGWKSVEQVAAELNALYPEPVLGQPLAVDIIRAERDAR